MVGFVPVTTVAEALVLVDAHARYDTVRADGLAGLLLVGLAALVDELFLVPYIAYDFLAGLATESLEISS